MCEYCMFAHIERVEMNSLSQWLVETTFIHLLNTCMIWWRCHPQPPQLRLKCRNYVAPCLRHSKIQRNNFFRLDKISIMQIYFREPNKSQQSKQMEKIQNNAAQCADSDGDSINHKLVCWLRHNFPPIDWTFVKWTRTKMNISA